MKEINISKEYIVMVDDCDYEQLILHKWSWTAGYAQRSSQKNGVRKSIRMHRQILNVYDDRIIDHINGNGLDNRRSNLRICTKRENQLNKKGWGFSIYKGVDWYKSTSKWRSKISIDGRQIHLGFFEDELSAALAYDDASRKYHGEYSKTNFQNNLNMPVA